MLTARRIEVSRRKNGKVPSDLMEVGGSNTWQRQKQQNNVESNPSLELHERLVEGYQHNQFIYLCVLPIVWYKFWSPSGTHTLTSMEFCSNRGPQSRGTISFISFFVLLPISNKNPS